MAPHESVEIRLVCKADYSDPQLRTKLREIRDNLKQLLRTGRRRFALKKIQPWNSIKVTFDIPKEAADRLRVLAAQGNARLIELGILSVEVTGQSNAIVVNSQPTPSTTANSSEGATPIQKSVLDPKVDDHCSKPVKTEPNLHPPSNHRHGQVVHPSYPKNSGEPAGSYNHDHTHDSWSGYKMKVNGIHYYPSQQAPYELNRRDTNLSAQCVNTTPTPTNSLRSL